MDYSEIKAKYATDAAVRSAVRKTLQNDVDFAKTRLNEINNRIEALRPKTGLLSADDSQEWDYLRFKRNEAQRVLNEAHNKLNEFEANTVDMNAVAEVITH